MKIIKILAWLPVIGIVFYPMLKDDWYWRGTSELVYGFFHVVMIVIFSLCFIAWQSI